MRITVKKFDDFFSEEVTALMQSLPTDLRKASEEIIFTTRSRPTGEQIDGEGDDELLGLFEGTALTERHVDDWDYLPARITLFRHALAGMCSTEKELRMEIRLTLVHELAHFFGFSEEELEQRRLD